VDTIVHAPGANSRRDGQPLTKISPSVLWARFDAQAAEAADIYGWQGDETQCSYVSENYQALQMYFSQAAAAGEAMLLHLS